jgi:hypothetical protein
MTPYNPRIVFAAVVAFTDKVTRDGRMLVTPESFRAPVVLGRELPVLWTPPNQNGRAMPTLNAGMIEQAYVVDKRVIAFGHLHETTAVKTMVVPMLQSGARFLEIDVDSGDMQYDLQSTVLDPVPVGPVIFKSWKLRAAWVGPTPAWDLPLVQVEEITR